MKFVFLEIRSFYHRAPLLHRLCSTQKQISATALAEKIMALRTPEVLRMLEMDDDMDDDMECETDVEEPICEGSDDDLGLEISDEEERLVYSIAL